MKKVFNISLRSLDRGKRKVTWLKGNAHGVIPYLLDDFLMNGRVADNPFFANLFPASLKLGLDQADDLAVLVDAPTSIQTLPDRLTSNSFMAFSSFRPPRLT